MKLFALIGTTTLALTPLALASQCPDMGVFKKVVQDNKHAIASGNPFKFFDGQGSEWRSINYYHKPDQGKPLSLDESLELSGFNWETAGENACRGDSTGFTILIHKK
jgi:hypothetical protein